MKQRPEKEQLVVFISGTMRDLPEERRRVANAIRDTNLEPTWAEGRGATNRPSRDECERMARTCDVYLGLYGLTYGWKFPPEEAISATEFEWETAREAGKPMLIYRQKGQPDSEQAVFLGKVGNWQKGRFWYEFDALEDLIPKLRADLARLIAESFHPGINPSIDLWFLRNYERSLHRLVVDFGRCKAAGGSAGEAGSLDPKRYARVAEAWRDCLREYSAMYALGTGQHFGGRYAELIERIYQAKIGLDVAVADGSLRRIPDLMSHFEIALAQLEARVSVDLDQLVR